MCVKTGYILRPLFYLQKLRIVIVNGEIFVNDHSWKEIKSEQVKLKMSLLYCWGSLHLNWSGEAGLNNTYNLRAIVL